MCSIELACSWSAACPDRDSKHTFSL